MNGLSVSVSRRDLWTSCLDGLFVHDMKSCLAILVSTLILDNLALRALLVNVCIFKLKVLFPYFTCNFGRVGPSFDHDGTAI